MKAKEYKNFLHQLPRGTITRAAKKMGVKHSSIYYAIESGNTEVIEMVVEIKKEIQKAIEEKNRRIQKLIA